MSTNAEPVEPTPVDWPEHPTIDKADPKTAELEYGKLRYAAEVGEVASARKSQIPELQYEADLALRKADYDSEYALKLLFHQSMFEVTKNSVDRVLARAELVEKAAASIGVLYAGIIGVSFSVSEHRLPLRGAIPAIFLGAAIVLSMIYLAYLGRSGSMTLPTPTTSRYKYQTRRLAFFVEWVAAATSNRKEFLRSAILCLAFGVIFMPAPFLNLPHDDTTTVKVDQTPWPDPPSISNVELAKIRYQAEITEAATQRSREPETTIHEDHRIWWFVAAAALIASLPLLLANPSGPVVRFFRWVRKLKKRDLQQPPPTANPSA